MSDDHTPHTPTIDVDTSAVATCRLCGRAVGPAYVLYHGIGFVPTPRRCTDADDCLHYRLHYQQYWTEAQP